MPAQPLSDTWLGRETLLVNPIVKRVAVNLPLFLRLKTSAEYRLFTYLSLKLRFVAQNEAALVQYFSAITGCPKKGALILKRYNSKTNIGRKMK